MQLVSVSIILFRIPWVYLDKCQATPGIIHVYLERKTLFFKKLQTQAW